VGERGGFFQRLDRGTYPAHILEHVTIELQSLCGSEVGFGRARAIDEDAGLYRVIVEYEEEELAKACLLAGREILLAALNGRDYDVPFLGSLPLDIRIREQADSGRPTVVADPDGAVAKAYMAIARKVAVAVAQKAQDYSAKLPSISIQNT